MRVGQREEKTMSSRWGMKAVLAIGIALAGSLAAHAQQDHATPQEVVYRVRQAAKDIAELGEEGLATYRGRNVTSVWKDSYVTVLSCEGWTALTATHPIQPEFQGRPVAQTLTAGPKPGEQITAEFCAAGRKPHGGWVAYNFHKP